VTGVGARSQDTLATLLLVNHLTDAGAPPLTPREFWQVAEGGAPSRLLGLDAEDLAHEGAPLDAMADRVARLLAASSALAFALDQLGTKGYAVLTPFDEDYPKRLLERLEDEAPPALFAVGPVELLSADAIGIVGSRDVSSEAVEVARGAAEAVAEAGFVITSGGARGSDQQTMGAAYRRGGKVAGYLADSLERRVKDPGTRRVVSEGGACFASMLGPNGTFSTENAVARNRVIYAGSRATFVVASDREKGATWAGATEAMKHGYGRVLVWRGEGEGPGNAAITDLGATPITSIQELLAAAADPSTDPARQMRLGS
jgi:DNA processing protein